MARTILVDVLDGFARDASLQWQMPDVEAPMPKNGSPRGVLYRAGPSWVMQSMFNFHFADEFKAVYEMMLDGYLPSRLRDDFTSRTESLFTPRDDKEFEKQLRERLAISPAGDHIDGAVGLVEIARRVVGRQAVLDRRPIMRRVNPADRGSDWYITGYRERTRVVRLEWPVYEGEGHERAAGRIRAKIGVGEGADPLPEGTEGLPVGANAPQFSAASAIAMLDDLQLSIDIGSTASTIAGRTGAQPVDPDAAETGTLLFTLTCSDPVAGAAVDDTDGTVSLTFSAITDDASADATDTLSYCRMKATGAGADDVLDGEAGTSGADYNYNTLNIVSGSTVSMTSLVIGMSQGSTAT